MTIGENSLIGASSVVTKNIPWSSIAYGVSARISKII
jgi:acetyltransferase-like isoleucine patch superfamily enzyme